jgi:hypothetical protein
MMRALAGGASRGREDFFAQHVHSNEVSRRVRQLPTKNGDARFRFDDCCKILQKCSNYLVISGSTDCSEKYALKPDQTISRRICRAKSKLRCD